MADQEEVKQVTIPSAVTVSYVHMKTKEGSIDMFFDPPLSVKKGEDVVLRVPLLINTPSQESPGNFFGRLRRWMRG